MKKLLCLSMLVSMCLLTGCTKNYKTVEDYESAMKNVRKNGNYTMLVKQDTKDVSLTYKTLLKDDKWKTEMSMNGGSSYMSTILFNGQEILQYSQGSPYAIINPMASILEEFENEDEKQMSMSMINPPMNLIYWDNHSFLYDSETPTFGSKKENKNGFDCRMINYGDNDEICVSDKYGVAVYRKLKNDKVGDIVYNLTKIETSSIPDNEFELPNGVKKMDLDSMLQDLDKKMKSFGK